LGGAFVGAAPQLTYRYMLERLSSRGYLVVATPYQLSFDHLATCDEVIGRFEMVAPDLARREFVSVWVERERGSFGGKGGWGCSRVKERCVGAEGVEREGAERDTEEPLAAAKRA